MAFLLVVVGSLAALIGYVWILVSAFTDSALWGLGILIIGPLGLVYGILSWDELKTPTLLMGGGTLVYFLGSLLA